MSDEFNDLQVEALELLKKFDEFSDMIDVFLDIRNIIRA